MPIINPVVPSGLTQEQFAELDYRVMHHAFLSQNELGRLCDEVIYQNDVALRLEKAGLAVKKEVPLVVTHDTFTKRYWLDLLVSDGAIYEFKTASKFTGEHEAQLMNYLLLFGVQHGKLVNFRPSKVESRFVNTTLTREDRLKFKTEMIFWREEEDFESRFRDRLLDLLADWGCWLDLALYLEALVHFAGGEAFVARQLPLRRDGVILGNQRFHLLSPDVSFRLTGLTTGLEEHEEHLRFLLRLSPLRRIQWVNLGRNRVQLKTIVR